MVRCAHQLGAVLVAMAVALGGVNGVRASDAPAAGVSADLAKVRARNISHLRYALALSIPATRTQPVTGVNTLHFRLSELSQPLVIDFDAAGASEATVTANGRVVPTRAVNGHLVVSPAVLRRGENTVRIDFRAGDAPLNRGDDLLYTWFVPANARRALPCFDQPDLKGRWSVELEHPAAWQSVANGAERDRHSTGDRVRVRFHPTEPLPTYLLAFVVGDMKVESATRAGRAMRMFHRENDVAKLMRNRDAIFDLHAGSLAWLEEYTGIRYPFGKFDFVLIPAFQPGAMEHPGNIAYKAESLLLDESATQAELLDRARVIAHETAHTWFGNLVTMRWFDDVWMKEVFANFIADKVVVPQFPQVRHDLQFFGAHFWSAYAVDRAAGSNPIRQPLDNLVDAGSLYGSIVYDKSPVVIRQLEALLGESAFRDGLRRYLRRYAFGNATWDELIAILGARTKLDLAQWSRIWVDEPGRPVIRTELVLHDLRVQRLVLRQQDPHGRNRLWPQQLRVTVGCGSQTRRIVVEMTGREADLRRSLGSCVPDYVLAGGEGWGYGDFQLDDRSQAFLETGIARIDDPLARGVAWSALWEAVLGGRMAPARWYDMATLALRAERNERLVDDWLYDLNVVWWRFLTPAQRAERARALEALLRDRLDTAPEPGQKSSWFAGLQSVAITPDTVNWLRALWQREATIPGLPLVETDETALAFALAVRDVADEQQILDAQRDRITNPDRRARFEFVRGAAVSDAGARERWFRALEDPPNRRSETWVLQGLGLMNHPLRAGHAGTLLPKAMDLLLDVHRTGALFFDEAWVKATLRGHSSPQAAAVVTRFIDTLPPDYPPRLRAKVLQGSDLLMRAARSQALRPSGRD